MFSVKPVLGNLFARILPFGGAARPWSLFRDEQLFPVTARIRRLSESLASELYEVVESAKSFSCSPPERVARRPAVLAPLRPAGWTGEPCRPAARSMLAASPSRTPLWNRIRRYDIDYAILVTQRTRDPRLVEAAKKGFRLSPPAGTW